MRKLTATLMGVSTLALGYVLGSITTGSNEDVRAEPKPIVRVEPSVVKSIPPTGVGNGTWSVPGEVKPGTYVTTAKYNCYWARLANFDGELNSIITNGNLDEGAQGRITIKPTDKGITLSGGCYWKKA